MDIDPGFLAFLHQEESRAFDGALLEEVSAALSSYNGEPYGDEEDGRSQVVARDVAETTDYMLTSLMDVMVSSGRICEFEPTDEKDEQVADDATEALHYLYRRKSGYRLMHDWAKAGLIEKIGVVKCCVERKKQRVESLYPSALLPEPNDPAWQKIVAAEPAGQAMDDLGNPIDLHRVVSLEEGTAQFIDYHVPLEEFLRAPDARDLDSAVYLCHLTETSISELVEMGFDADSVQSAEGSNPMFTQLATIRDDGRQSWIGVLDRDGPNRKVWLREEYVMYDLNGDGLSERLCVHRVGNGILTRNGQLAIEEIDYQPFEFWCPFPMQGRLIGQSLADKVIDIQRVNTVLERNALDSLYQQTAPGTFVHEDSVGDHTIDDLLTVRPGRVVRWTGSVKPEAEQRNDVSQVAFAAIDFKTKQRESRTGITRLNKGVDEDALNETAKGQAQLMARGQQMERYVIRNFAEGVSRLFMKKVGLMRKYGQPFQIRVEGEYRVVDPTQWPEDMEVMVTVGLGSGSKQDRLQYRQLVAQTHTLLMQGQSPVCTWENVYNNLTAAARDAGLAPNDIYTNPNSPEAQQQMAQQQANNPQLAELQFQMQVKQQELMQAQQEMQGKLQLMAQKHASEAEMQAYKDQMEATIALRQQNLQMWLDMHEMKMQAEKHKQDMALSQQESKAKISKMRAGGALDK